MIGLDLSLVFRASRRALCAFRLSGVNNQLWSQRVVLLVVHRGMQKLYLRCCFGAGRNVLAPSQRPLSDPRLGCSGEGSMSALAARTLVGTSRVLPAYVISTLVMLQRAADLLTDVESGVVLCLFRVRVLMCAPFLSQCIAVPVAAAVSGIVALGQGRVRTKTVKKSARVIIEKYYSRLTLDFQTNKRICDEVAIIPSKRLRNKIAGFVTVCCGCGVGDEDDVRAWAGAGHRVVPEQTRSARPMMGVRCWDPCACGVPQWLWGSDKYVLHRRVCGNLVALLSYGLVSAVDLPPRGRAPPLALHSI